DSASHPTEPGVARTEEVAAQADAARDVTHQYEHGKHREVVIGELGERKIFQLIQQHRRPGKHRYAAHADEQHRVGNRHAHHDERDEHDEAADSCLERLSHDYSKPVGMSVCGVAFTSPTISPALNSAAITSRNNETRIGGNAVQSGMPMIGVYSE